MEKVVVELEVGGSPMVVVGSDGVEVVGLVKTWNVGDMKVEA